MLWILVILRFLNEAHSSDITARGDRSVVYGQDASLSCAFSRSSGVRQVIWQRVRGGERAQTLATFSERFRDHVDDQYVGKVTLTSASFNATTIVIKNVTFEDEACYICAFNVYPAGPQRETLCLTVSGISELRATVTAASNLASDADVTVSCSATGKPAPILQWKSTETKLNLQLSNNSSQVNRDTSATATSNLTLPLSHFHGKFVECVAQSGNIQERYQIYIPGDDDEGNNITERNYIITVTVLVIMLMIIFVVTVICLYSRLNGAIFRMKATYTESLTDQAGMEC